MRLPKEYKRLNNGGWSYDGHVCIASCTCETHGQYPTIYIDDSGNRRTIYNKDCPYCHLNEIVESKLGRSLIPPRFRNKTLEGYTEAKDFQRRAKAKVAEYIKSIDDNIAKGASIIMVGGVGTGKTHLSVALLRSAIENGYSGLFITASDLFISIRDTWGRNGGVSTSERVQQYKDIDLLVIDEIGVQRGTDNEKEILFSIINDRYNNIRPTVLLSNLSVDRVRDYIGERIYDRMKEDGGSLIVLNGESYRK